MSDTGNGAQGGLIQQGVRGSPCYFNSDGSAVPGDPATNQNDSLHPHFARHQRIVQTLLDQLFHLFKIARPSRIVWISCARRFLFHEYTFAFSLFRTAGLSRWGTVQCSRHSKRQISTALRGNGETGFCRQGRVGLWLLDSRCERGVRSLIWLHNRLRFMLRLRRPKNFFNRHLLPHLPGCHRQRSRKGLLSRRSFLPDRRSDGLQVDGNDR